MEKIINSIKIRARSISLFFTGLMNLLYISASIFSGVFYNSLWYFSLTLCHLLLLFSRFYLFSKTSHKEPTEKEGKRISGRIGIILLGLNLLALFLSIYSLLSEKSTSYGNRPLPIFFLFTLYSITLSLLGLKRGKREPEYVYISYRTITLTTAMISLYNLVYSVLFEYIFSERLSMIILSFLLSLVFTVSTASAVYLLTKKSENRIEAR